MSFSSEKVVSSKSGENKSTYRSSTVDFYMIGQNDFNFFTGGSVIKDWRYVNYLWIIVMFLSAVWKLIPTAPIHYKVSIGEQVM